MQTEAQKRANRKYNQEKCDSIRIRVQKGEKARIAAFAQANGESMNGMIVRLIREEMERG